MIALEFSRTQIELLKAGSLTQARLVCRPSEVLRTKTTPLDSRFGEIPAIAELWSDAKHRELFEGKWLCATCGGVSYGQVLVKNIRQDECCRLLLKDARACGFEGIGAFKLDWDSTHRLKNQKWDANPLVWVVDLVYYTHVFAG